jgi:hypothetical protein
MHNPEPPGTRTLPAGHAPAVGDAEARRDAGALPCAGVGLEPYTDRTPSPKPVQTLKPWTLNPKP